MKLNPESHLPHEIKWFSPYCGRKHKPKECATKGETFEYVECNYVTFFLAVYDAFGWVIHCLRRSSIK